MDFAYALKALQEGNHVSRLGWNGKGMWIAAVSSNWSGDIAGGSMPSDWKGYSPFIVMFTADKLLVPWLCSQTDLLAEDWGLV